jgi:hypothetical protein
LLIVVPILTWAMVALRYAPDIPFFFIGIASLVLTVVTKIRGG